MDELQEHISETTQAVPPQRAANTEPMSFVERHNIHPFLFAIATLIIIFVLYQVGGGLIVFFATGTGSVTPGNVQLVRLLTMAGQIFFLFVPTIWFARLFSRRTHELFSLRMPSVQESLLALAALFSLQRVCEAYMFFQDKIPVPKLLQDFLDPLKKMMENLTAVLIHSDSLPELFFVILVVAIVPAIAEELLFRGLIQHTFNKIMPPVAAAMLTGIIFGLYHVNPFELVPLVGLGIFFGILRYRSQSLVVPMAAHFINNVLAVLAGYFGMANDTMLETVQFTPAVSTVLFEFLIFGILFVWSFLIYLRVTRSVCAEKNVL
ncbi:MAG TPA: CPBP family intramembrane glutamic endopeptidase [Bacteroidota bacterium]|nr:CPBP family intramembrane glutamic endopeptidase [Bacteroidota bacterium]